MKIKVLDKDISVCKVKDYSLVNFDSEFYTISKTDEENSLVCETKDVPNNTIEVSSNWRAFRLVGVLDFSLIGILSKIANILAENSISIFALSTYNTDYILVKADKLDLALEVLEENGYETK